ncbi:fumarate hydratase C-terminal domain-containing protein [Verminephrobacter eiseniae]|uniref:Fumarate hydratase class I beta subunit n=1 Tax=Verminephrobacter eiseniae (strain EF01-2) TaxID=391735 RepID=A1WMD4_VEREI|nr:fumarate hydratase C-terminal domain-containing protein [Verminephrobacter eiseniae]KAB7578591.1 fumarate hydratase [Verminephrobacter sp. Larva24]ABM58791.1 fumarate hydratase class I beta subunit [Verminephrobacter eiseniae EF01-2]MCW5230858.1 fumarate hydratase [Verminephrobacter eiseniae]MCW5284360.1 fumarate hydratase [Verminephrobacter eiseniae]MCW5292591.1 fumarate hydratase [Verminephrobacter eiseniae]
MFHPLVLPLSRDKVRALAVGDMVTLDGEITVSIGLQTHQRMVQAVGDGQALPVDLRAGAFFHLSTCVRDTGDGPQPLYTNPSTSTRYNAWMPSLVRGLDLRLTGGKGGLDAASVQALRDTGCVYLSFLGGGAPLLSRGLRGLVSSHWNEYISQFRLLTLRVAAFGPATVAIDAHGNSLYEQLRGQAQARMPQLLQRLDAARKASR